MITKKTGNKRLLKLANFLTSDQVKKHFNLRSFISVGSEAKKERIPAGEVMAAIYENDRACGTTACAIGWAPIALPDLFRYEYDDRYPYLPEIISQKTGKTYWYAVMDVFVITDDEAYFLFLDSNYKDGARTTAKQVSNRIKKFVAERESNVVQKMR